MKNTLLLSLFFLLFLHRAAVAQQNGEKKSDSVFTKYASKPTSRFDPAKPYYIAFSDETMPANTIRAINRNVGIIEIESKAVLDSLGKKLQLAAANDRWKFSPAMEVQLEKLSGKEQKFVLSGQNIDALVTELQTNFPSLPMLSI
ncbi:MAG TPA: hypothetical protein VFL47_09860, partial [Flavisolibacter sp.]|nr:hypothetical protein [Flavisolibacter sp.]